MGALDEKQFDELVRGGCTACGHRILEIRTYIDKSLVVMAGDPNNEGRWAHDGEKFVDGTFLVTCTACHVSLFASDLCPRCNAADALKSSVQSVTSRITVPKRCPKCNELELLAVALVPAAAKYGDGGTPKPKQLVDFGDAGYHVVAYACNGCDNAVVSDRCPLCDSPGPLRPRP
jgi:hypothetical protein